MFVHGLHPAPAVSKDIFSISGDNSIFLNEVMTADKCNMAIINEAHIMEITMIRIIPL